MIGEWVALRKKRTHAIDPRPEASAGGVDADESRRKAHPGSLGVVSSRGHGRFWAGYVSAPSIYGARRRAM